MLCAGESLTLKFEVMTQSKVLCKLKSSFLVANRPHITTLALTVITCVSKLPIDLMYKQLLIQAADHEL